MYVVPVAIVLAHGAGNVQPVANGIRYSNSRMLRVVPKRNKLLAKVQYCKGRL